MKEEIIWIVELCKNLGTNTYKRILNNKSKLVKALVVVLFLSGMLYVISMVYFDKWGPTSKNDTKFIDIYENIDNNGPAGTFRVNGMYTSKGVVSANKVVEFYIFEIEYYVNKESFKGFVGQRNIWPPYIDVSVCPKKARASGDFESVKTPCINIKLDKLEYDNGFVQYSYRSQNLMNKIEFLTSGHQSMRIDSGIKSFEIENVFEIAPTYVNAELELNKYMLMLTILGLVAVSIQIFEFIKK